MNKISEEAQLSERYTNYCLRATTVTALSHAGIAPKDIFSVTGHRSEASLKHYCEEATDEQKTDMSKKLHSYIKIVSIVKQSQKVLRSHQFCLNKTMQWLSHQNLDHLMPLMGPVMQQCCHAREFPILPQCQTLSPSIQLLVRCLLELYSMGLLHLIFTKMCCIRTRISCICVCWLLWVSISLFFWNSRGEKRGNWYCAWSCCLEICYEIWLVDWDLHVTSFDDWAI